MHNLCLISLAPFCHSFIIGRCWFISAPPLASLNLLSMKLRNLSIFKTHKTVWLFCVCCLSHLFVCQPWTFVTALVLFIWKASSELLQTKVVSLFFSFNCLSANWTLSMFWLHWFQVLSLFNCTLMFFLFVIVVKVAQISLLEGCCHLRCPWSTGPLTQLTCSFVSSMSAGDGVEAMTPVS